MKLRFVFLGFEVWSLELDSAPEVEAEEAECDVAGIGSGSAHNFERDLNPPDAQGEVPWDEYEDRGFGFRR